MAKPRGRPHIEINVDELKKLAALGCTNVEIATFFAVSVDTLTRNYADKLMEGRELGKMSFRRIMYDQAKRGNSFALKHLTKTILKESVDDGLDIRLMAKTISTMSDQELDEFIKKTVLEAQSDAKPTTVN